MNYETKKRAIEAAREMNKDLGYVSAWPVQNEKGIFTVVRGASVQRWLLAHSERKLLCSTFGVL
jgi:hypothetical protein